MPELRQDRFTKEWVFVASENIQHPQELVVPRARKSVPSFDPNTFIPSIKAKDWAALQKDEAKPLINRAISTFPPGSTFKIVTSLAGLRKKMSNSRYNCSRHFPLIRVAHVAARDVSLCHAPIFSHHVRNVSVLRSGMDEGERPGRRYSSWRPGPRTPAFQACLPGGRDRQ